MFWYERLYLLHYLEKERRGEGASDCRSVIKGTFLAMYEALGIWVHVSQRDKTLSRMRVYTYSPSPDLEKYHVC